MVGFRYTASGTIIAMSYEAKAMGVKRTMNARDARQACPKLVICQVPTSFEKADLTRYRDAGSEVGTVLGCACVVSNSFFCRTIDLMRLVALESS